MDPTPPTEGWEHHLQLWREGEEECLASAIETFAESKSRGGEGPKYLESRRAVCSWKGVWSPLATLLFKLGNIESS